VHSRCVCALAAAALLAPVAASAQPADVIRTGGPSRPPDAKDDYVTSEPAIDYTADSILLLAVLSR
jgi:hypothetical protein